MLNIIIIIVLLNSTFKKTKITHQSKDTIIKVVNKHFISGPDINYEQGSYASHADHQQK